MQHDNKPELLNLIEFAFAENRYKDAIELSQKYISQIGPAKQIYVYRAQSYLQMSQPHSALVSLESAQKYGAQFSQIGLIKVRCYLQLQNIQESNTTLLKLLKQKPDLQKLINYHNAIEILKDKDNKHRLSSGQQQIFTSMKHWLYKAGGKYDKLKVINFSESYRGVITTKTIKKGQPIVYIPKSQILTLEMAKANRYSKQLINRKIKLLSPKHTYISILLLEERANPKSKWKPYIDLLPKDHACFPINYTNQELQMLIGSPFLFMINERVKDLKRDYDIVVKICKQFEKYSFRDFCWARSMVGSRIFGLVISGVKTEVLVPFADMLNHKLPKQTVWNYVEPMDGFIIESQQEIDPGQQVFDSYGRKCNSRFLLNYGFIIEDNMDNQIALKLSISQDDALAKLKLKMMKQNESDYFSCILKISFNLSNNKFYELMGCLRFCSVSDLQNLKVLYKISNIEQTKEAYKWSRTPPISLTNQIQSWGRFIQLCKQSLGNYPNTIEEDRKLLKQPTITQNQKNIINIRMGQKYILTEFIQIGQQILAILESKAMLDILEKQKDKIYYRYLCKMLSVMPGVNKPELFKKIGVQGGTISQVEEMEDQEEEIDENN